MNRDLTVGDYRSAACPMPDCHGVLYVERTGTYGISEGDLRLREPLHRTDDHSSSWQVVCDEGHVILLPVDDAADTHEFQVADWTRLAAVIERIAQ